MNCPKCGNPIPDNLLSCTDCTIKTNDRAVREYQYLHLLAVANGDGPLVTYRGTDFVVHVLMWGSDAAYCGKAISAPKHKRRYTAMNDEGLKYVCPACVASLKAILEEARLRELDEQPVQP